MLLSLSNIFSSISVHHLCCALRPNQLSKILPSLMLPSKICRALFQHSTFFCFAPKISLRFLNILPSSMLCSKMFSSISLHSTISDAILQGVLFNFWASAMLCSKILLFFSSPPSLLMLRFKIFSSTYKILPSLYNALLQGLLQNVQASSLLRYKTSFQFSNIIYATLPDLLVSLSYIPPSWMIRYRNFSSIFKRSIFIIAAL